MLLLCLDILTQQSQTDEKLFWQLYGTVYTAAIFLCLLSHTITDFVLPNTASLFKQKGLLVKKREAAIITLPFGSKYV